MAFVSAQTSRLTVGDREWSADLTGVDSSTDIETIETTTLGDTSKVYLVGEKSGTLNLTGLLNAATAGTANSQWQDLKAIRGDSDGVPALVALGGFTAGNDCWVAQVTETSWSNSSTVAGAAGWTLNMGTTGDMGHGDALYDPADATVGAGIVAGTAVDNSSSTANGGVTNLCVVAASGTSPTLDVIVKHSADNITYTTLATFTQATGLTSERVAVAAGTTVNRYLKATATIGGTAPSFKFAVGFARL